MYRDAAACVKKSLDQPTTSRPLRYLEIKVDELSQLNRHCDEIIDKLNSINEYLGHSPNKDDDKSPEEVCEGQRDFLNSQINRLGERLCQITNQINKLEESL